MIINDINKAEFLWKWKYIKSSFLATVYSVSLTVNNLSWKHEKEENYLEYKCPEKSIAIRLTWMKFYGDACASITHH